MLFLTFKVLWPRNKLIAFRQGKEASDEQDSNVLNTTSRFQSLLSAPPRQRLPPSAYGLPNIITVAIEKLFSALLNISQHIMQLTFPSKMKNSQRALSE